MMTNKDFWNLIGKSKEQGVEQLDWLIKQLSMKTKNEIVEFDIKFRNMMEKSYTSSLWGAAFVIMGGCSDDGFDYFRAWLIAQGEEVFNKAIETLEFLNEYLSESYLQHDEFAPQWEEMLSVALDAYTYQKTGDTEYNDSICTEFSHEIDSQGYEFKPIEIEIDWEEEDLMERYPILWERFGEDPLT